MKDQGSDRSRKPQSLFKHNWRNYVRMALVPLVLIELLLVAVYLLTNHLIKKENIVEVRQIADNELSRIVAQEAAIIGRDLVSIQQLTEIYRKQTALAFQSPFDPGQAEKSRYRFTDGGAWYAAVDNGGSGAFYSGAVPVGEAEMRKALQLAQLDPLMADIQTSNPLVAQVYLNTKDSYNRIYPYLNGDEQYSDGLVIPNFNFYYLADARHNPSRGTVWTEVYVDPAGQGWMASCIAPVYVGDELEAVVGLDVTVKTMVERILAMHIPWQGYGLLLDGDGVIMAMSEEAERDFGLRELTVHRYQGAIEQDQFKPKEFQIAERGPLSSLSERIMGAVSGSAALPFPDGKLVSWSTVPQTGWKLVALVDEDALYSHADSVESRFMRLGVYMVITLVLFYLLFFSFLNYRARRESRVIAAQLIAMKDMAQAMGQGDYRRQPPTSDVLEIQDTARQLALMGKELETSVSARQAREQELENILQTAREGFWQIDNQTRTLRVNAALCSILDRSEDEILGRDIYQFVDEVNRRIFQAQVEKRARGEAGHYDIELLRPDGSQIPCSFNVSPLFDEEGNKVGAFALVSDISQRKAAEDSLRTAKEAAESASRAKTEFLSLMSHEIRTPLNGVLGMLQLLQRTALDRQQHHYVNTMKASGRHLLGLVENILDFSKIEAGRLELEIDAFDPRRLAEETIGLFREAAEEKNIALQLQVDDEICGPLLGDAQRLRQVLVNLLDNAIRFTEAGWVQLELRELEVEETGLTLLFSVNDSGSGVSPDMQQAIFEVFSRQDSSTTRQFDGAGLGLPICHRLVSLMGGMLKLESSPGEGTRCSFELRFKKADDPVSSAEAPKTPLGHWRLSALLAEDNPVNAEVAESMLRQLGCEVVSVEDGRLAVEAYEERHFDLILMDLHMPNMDGWEATRRIRAMSRPPDAAPTYIIALTADVVQGTRKQCLDAGMDAYLAKPFVMETLRAQIGEWFEVETQEHAGPEEKEPIQAAAVLETAALAQIKAMQKPNAPSLLKRVLGLYQESSRDLMEKIRHAVETRNASQLAEAAHSLKSASANVGAQNFSALCRLMEINGRQNNIAEAQKQLHDLEREYQLVSAALVAEIESADGSQ